MAVTKCIAIDTSSIIKLDTHIKALPCAFPSTTMRMEIDKEANDTIQYAIKAGHCTPIFIGQVAPMYYADAFAFFKHIAKCKYYTKLCSFTCLNMQKVKQQVIDTWNGVLEYAFDRVVDDAHIWQNAGIEVLT